MKSIKTALITGDHTFDVSGLYDMFRGFDGVTMYPQHILDFCGDTGDGKSNYEVLIFYNMTTDTPGPAEENALRRAMRDTIDELGDTGQGIVVLHHAILAFPDWSKWSDIVGIRDRDFGYFENQNVTYTIAAPDHPIVRGIDDFSMVDETYTMKDAGDDSTILITTDHDASMKTIAWCRIHGGARVFCYQSGHNRSSFDDRNFRAILRNGIFWAAERS